MMPVFMVLWTVANTGLHASEPAHVPNSRHGLSKTQSAAIGSDGAATIRAADRGHVEMILGREEVKAHNDAVVRAAPAGLGWG